MESIQEIIGKIIILLEANDEHEWADYLEHLMHEYENSEAKVEAIKNILNIYKGGMGSFTDLVLQKDFKMLVDENNQLAALKHNLYNSCLNYCAKHNIKIE